MSGSNSNTQQSMSLLFRDNLGEIGSWREDELGAILTHQLSAPMAIDLEPFLANVADRDMAVEALKRAGDQTFRELFTAERPPLPLLELVKVFSKMHGKVSTADGVDGLPREVAAVIYLCAICAARFRFGQRITEMSDRSLGARLAWVESQAWVDEQIADLLRQCRESFLK